jgi:DNA-binding transcriptional regulator YhcF (GntR family)
MTISKAYSYLERENVLERRPGRPLIVKAFTAEQLRARKVDLLRQGLAPASTTARRLGFDAGEALAIFRQMLDHAAEEEGLG